MLIRPLFLVSALTFGLAGCIINVNGTPRDAFDYHQQTQLSIEANRLETLVADTGAGFLRIEGVDGASQITLEADIYGYDGAEPELTLIPDGRDAKLVANFDSFTRLSFSHSPSPYIDLVLKVPASMRLDIHDGSGGIVIQGVNADMQIDDGSGSIEINGGKRISIDDGSGAITLTQIEGKVSISDGSGSIEINGVGDDVVLEDGSGGILVENVDGKVTIDDGSGSIRVVNTQGLNILESGSGDLSFDKINGPVSMDD